VSGGAAALPELASVHWRAPASDESLTRSGRLWTVHTVGYAAPFVVAAALLVALAPVTTPFALILLAHAWVVPELYAARGAKVVRKQKPAAAAAEMIALGFLGDLLDDPGRALLEQTGLALARGRFGTWLVGEQGALLIRPGGRRVHCYCVRVTEPELPSSDRVAHLLLALRTDEVGFATVANLVFSGACWRLHRRLGVRARLALACARSRAVQS
jgi:hypothetical protein